MLSWPALTSADTDTSPVFELVVGTSVLIPVESVAQAVVLNEKVCTAHIEPDGRLRLIASNRGETVVLVWLAGAPDDRPLTVIARVLPAPPPPVSTVLTSEQRDAVGHGSIGSLVHVGVASSGAHSTSLLTPFSWTRGTAGGRFTMYGQMQRVPGSTSGMNLDNVSAQFARGTLRVNALDLNVDLEGSVWGRAVPSAYSANVALRGADVSFLQGRNRYELFAGEVFPATAGSRQLAGITVHRESSDRRSIDATTAVIRAPDSLTSGTRQVRLFQTVGLTERPNPKTVLQGRVGAGTGGFHAQGSTAWQGDRTSAFATVSASSPEFGPQRLQLVYAPNAVIRAGGSWKLLPRLTAAAGYDYTATQATTLSPERAVSDLATISTHLSLSRAHTLSATSRWNRTRGLAFLAETTGRRSEIGLSSQFGGAFANAFQVSFGAVSDPFEVASRGEFSIRNNLSAGIGGGTLSVSFSHDRLSPSLVAALTRRIELLAPDLQTLFSDDPVAFVHSPRMPADVRLAIESLEPVDTTLSVTGQFGLGRNVSVAPTLSYVHNAQGANVTSVSEMVGYSLTWRATRSLEIQSSLTHALVIDPHRRALSRTSVFGIGVRKTFEGTPRWVSGSAGSRVGGRVFRDNNLDGVAQADEPGLPGVVVRLGDGSLTVTDALGRFEFRGLKPGDYRVRLSLEQLGSGARVTTPVDQRVQLYDQRTAATDFGVVHFGRLAGRVFNDIAMTGVRPVDAPGVRGVTVIVSGDDGLERRIGADDAGEFEVSDLLPGQYHLVVDPDTVPANYVSESIALDVQVLASTTATVSLPVRALRSIGGRVLFRRAGPSGSADQGPALVPLKGVQVTASGVTAVTDADGRFLLRNLAAGESAISVTALTPLPDGLTAPVGRVRLPADPIQLTDATIIIDNPRLLEFITPDSSAAP